VELIYFFIVISFFGGANGSLRKCENLSFGCFVAQYKEQGYKKAHFSLSNENC
jgi:hypothetical protein